MLKMYTDPGSAGDQQDQTHLWFRISSFLQLIDSLVTRAT